MNHPLFTLRSSIGSGDSLADIESQLHKLHTSGALHTTYTSMLLCSIPTRSGVFNQKKIIIQKSDFHCPEQCVEYYCTSPEYVYENSKTGFIRIFFSLFFLLLINIYSAVWYFSKLSKYQYFMKEMDQIMGTWILQTSIKS